MAAVPIAVGLPLDPLGLPARVGVVVLLLLMANAVNLIDGQDGLAGGLGAIASVGLAAVIAANGADPVLALVVAGALVGFLAWNLPPARVFLGNGGAYGLGALLTVLAAQATNGHGWHGLLAAASPGVFAFELTFTVVRRLLGSQRLATGDRGTPTTCSAAAAATGTAPPWPCGPWPAPATPPTRCAGRRRDHARGRLRDRHRRRRAGCGATRGLAEPQQPTERP